MEVQEQILPLVVPETLSATIQNAVVPEQASAEVAALIRKLNYVNGRTTFHINRIGNQPRSKGFLQSTLLSIKQLKDKLTVIEEALSDADALPVASSEAIGGRLLDLESFVTNQMGQLEADDHNVTAGHVTTSRVPRSEVKLPELTMPTFDGTPKKWIPFRKFVTDILVPHPAPDATKRIYLTNSLSGEPRSIVEAAPDETFVTALNLMKERYDNEVELTNDLLDEIYNIRTPVRGDAISLSNFVTLIEMNISQLKQVRHNVDSWDPFLSFFLLKRLDPGTRQEFEKERNPLEMAKTTELVKFLKTRIRVLNAAAPFKPVATSTPKDKGVIPKTTNYNTNKNSSPSSSNYRQQTHAAQTSDPKCPVCGESHKIYKCEQAKAKTVEQLREICESNHLCFNCLRTGHPSRLCLSKTNCRTCNRRHHTMLHPSPSTTPVSSPPKLKGEDESTNQLSAVAVVDKTIAVLATAVILVKDRYGNDIACRAFLDSGSTVSFMTTELANKLQLKKQAAYTFVDGINGSETVNKHQVTTVIASRLSDYSCETDFLITKKIVGNMPQQRISFDPTQLPVGMKLADPSFNEPGMIDVLLGYEIFFDVFIGPKLHIAPNLWAFDSKLGYFVVGKSTPDTPVTPAYTFVAIDELRNQIQSFWNIETLTIPAFSIEEKAAEQHFSEHVKRRTDSHYEVALPLKKSVHQLGDSVSKSRSLFLASEKRLARNPEKKRHYVEFINEMKSMGHLVKATGPLDDGYFMTHHLISRPTSTTTKFRVVFNASFRTSNGLSLNDVLMVGPTIQSDLFVHLLRWRERPVAVIADIEKMYRMVYVRDDDQKFQKIWWRDDPQEELEAYVITVVTYGTSSAPFQATRVLKQLAEDEALSYPDVVTDLEENFYMDDYTSSVEDSPTAHQKKRRLTELLNKGGFNLRKWHSNDPTLEDEPSASRLITVLGVPWDKQDDQVVLKFDHIKQHEELTKCSCLSEIAQLFDPLGLAAPVVVIAKIFMQKLWAANLTWDEPLPYELSCEWVDFRQRLNSSPALRINRVLIKRSGTVLHGFADASTVAYGCCVYMVENGISTLVCSKSRVAPLKTMTVPRLELCAAVLLAQLMARIIESLKRKPDAVFYWTDSEITYFRIHSTPARFNSFVGTRLAEIQSLSEPSKWRFVPGDMNPADIVSRGMQIDQLIECSYWWHGPEFIYNCEMDWPEQKIDVLEHGTDDEIQHKRAVAHVAIEKQTKQKLNAKLYRLFGPSSVQERHEVQLRLIRSLQHQTYEAELKLLSQGKQLPERNPLLKLNPFVDEDKLLRVGGRLGRSGLAYDHQHQVILPKTRISYLILKEIHEENMHAGPQALLGFSRQRFWVVGGRTQAKEVVHNCVLCFKRKPRMLKQIMADLPTDRTKCQRAFEVIGVDYCGYFELKPLIRSKTIRKCYVCVFTCFATRATHLELVHDLTTVSFLNALRRFVSRRGIPKKIYSDNATNFLGGKKELEELRNLMLSETHDEQVRKFLTNLGTQFVNIPARSPHWGCLWESMVKIFKYHFKRSIPNNVLHIDEFETLVIQAEAILNSRPLTPITDSPEDFDYLTPGHFLIGQPLNMLPEPTWRDENPNRLRAWQLIQRVTSDLWQRFVADYITDLQRRHKWKSTQDDVKLGTMVILHDDHLPPTQWRLGRIVKVHPGIDGHIRSVTVDTAHGSFRRSVTKVAPLPMEADD